MGRSSDNSVMWCDAMNLLIVCTTFKMFDHVFEKKGYYAHQGCIYLIKKKTEKKH